MAYEVLRQFANQLRLLEQRGYLPHEKQMLLHADAHRYKVIRCGRRFGKTVFAVNKIIEAAVLSQGDYWFVAPTYRQAESIAWRQLLRYLPSQLVAKKNETKLEIQLTNGSFIALKGADNPDSLRGVGLNGVVLDECAFIDPYAWTVLSPILQDRKGWAIFISTPNGYNWFYDLYNQHLTDPDFISFHFTSYDNPHLDPIELDKERARMSVERFEQEYMAEFNRKTGAIYTGLRRDIHLVPRWEISATTTVYGSIDFGFAIGHPTCVGWHAIRSDGHKQTFDGFLEEGLTIDEIDKKMRDQTNGLIIRGIYPDNARPDLTEDLRRRGWPMLDTRKDVEAGIAEVSSQIKINPLTNEPYWCMAEHLLPMFEQMEGYEWESIRGEDGAYKQVPKKRDDDAPDMERYFHYSYSQPYAAKKNSYAMVGGDPVTGFGRRRVRRAKSIEEWMP